LEALIDLATLNCEETEKRQLFRIFGTFHNSESSTQNNNFSGYLLHYPDLNNQCLGVTQIHHDLVSRRLLAGQLFCEDDTYRLVFFELSLSPQLSPILFVFSDIHQVGKWTNYPLDGNLIEPVNWDPTATASADLYQMPINQAVVQQITIAYQNYSGGQVEFNRILLEQTPYLEVFLE
jgi:hypothetical protein